MRAAALLVAVLWARAGAGGLPTSPQQPAPLAFLAMMSRWRDFELRDALRATWLHNLDAAHAQYRFFVEEARLLAHNMTLDSRGSVADYVALRSPRGTRRAWFNNTEQVLEMLQWALTHVAPAYIARVDTDGYLCTPSFLRVLRGSPRGLFFWGKYWCPAADERDVRRWRMLRRADENFMVLSAELARLTLAGFRAGRFRRFFGGEGGLHTFAMRFGPVTTEVGHVRGLQVLDDPFRLAHRFNTRGTPGWPPWRGGTGAGGQLAPPPGWDPCALGYVWVHPIKSAHALLSLGRPGPDLHGVPTGAARPDAPAVAPAAAAATPPLGTPALGPPCGYGFDAKMMPAARRGVRRSR